MAPIPTPRIEQARAAAAVLGAKIATKLPFVPGARPLTDSPVELVLNNTWRPTLAVTGAAGLPAMEDAGNVLLPRVEFKLSFRLPPTADAEQVRVKQQLGEAKSLVDFGVTGVVVQTNTKDILPMAGAGAIGFKIFFGETIGNLPFPDDGMCMEAFDYIAQSKLPLGIHAENRQIMAYCTNKLKTEGKNDARYWEASRPDICGQASIK